MTTPDDDTPDDGAPDDPEDPGELIPWHRLLRGSDREPEALDEVMTAGSVSEAQVVAALLRGEGIPLYVDGRLLQDEFAMSQALLGAGRKIMVPVSRIEEARAVIAKAREQGESLEDPAD